MRLTFRGPEFRDNREHYVVLDEAGVHILDAVLHLGEDGPVYRAGTTDCVACFSQSSATECDDDELAAALEAALLEHRRAQVRSGSRGP